MSYVSGKRMTWGDAPRDGSWIRAFGKWVEPGGILVQWVAPSSVRSGYWRTPDMCAACYEFSHWSPVTETESAQADNTPRRGGF